MNSGTFLSLFVPRLSASVYLITSFPKSSQNLMALFTCYTPETNKRDYVIRQPNIADTTGRNISIFLQLQSTVEGPKATR
jgi:hypothetical protein